MKPFYNLHYQNVNNRQERTLVELILW